MDAFFLLLFITAVGITSFLLHRHQLIQRDREIKRSLPLPPLGKSNLNPPLKGAKLHSKINKVDKKAPIKPVSWLQLVSEMRRKNDFDAALMLCREKFPLYTAYKQATIILRSRLDSKKTNTEVRKALTLELYKVAAAAELIHSKKMGSNNIPPSKLKRLDMERINSFSFKYNQLGYLELPLLTKQDIRIIVDMWGEPTKHGTPRVVYQKRLHELLVFQRV